jgi:hypothetical protein
MVARGGGRSNRSVYEMVDSYTSSVLQLVKSIVTFVALVALVAFVSFVSLVSLISLVAFVSLVYAQNQFYFVILSVSEESRPRRVTPRDHSHCQEHRTTL